MAKRYPTGFRIERPNPLVVLGFLAIQVTIFVWTIYVTLVVLNHVDAWPVNGWLGD